MAAAWSCTRLPISRASKHRAFGLARAVAGQPARGRDQRLGAQPHRVAATAGELAPGVEQRAPERLRLLAHRAMGRDRAPRDPTVAVEEPRERDARRRDRARPRRNARSPVRRRTRAERRRCRRRAHTTRPASTPSAVDSKSIATSRSMGPSAFAPAHERGLVEDRARGSCRAARRRRARRSRAAQAARRRAATGNATSGAAPASVSATPNVSGPTTCTLTARRHAAAARRDLEEGQQARMRVGRQLRVHRFRHAELGDELDRAVGVNGDAGNRARPLRDNPFERCTARKLRCGRHIGDAAQHERGGRVGVAVRKAADRGGHPRTESSPRHQDS